MPKPRKFELIQCTHFAWRLLRRDGVWYADGRSNKHNLGRHSLGTRDKEESRQRLVELDIQRASDLGLIVRPKSQDSEKVPITLEEGRRLYEEHLARSPVIGGAGSSTRKRYRTVFDKFLAFASTIRVDTWNAVNKRVLESYTANLMEVGYKTPRGKRKDYRHKTLHTELTTLKQCMGWLIVEGFLHMEKIHLPLKKAESERPYCWNMSEVAAMLEYCQQPALRWLRDVIVGLACTGLRISELAFLRWSDIDLEKKLLSLTDETAHRKHPDMSRRQTKSRRSRSFPLHEDLLDVFQRLPKKGTYIFHGPRGGRLKPDTVRNRLVDDVLKHLAPRFPSQDVAKGLIDGRPHSFRHYFCSKCANTGVPERMVMEWLGHADSAMVRHYYHLNDEEAQRQMQRLNLLGEAGKRFAGDNNGTAVSITEDTPGRESSK